MTKTKVTDIDTSNAAGGTTKFLRADGSWQTPPGGGGGGTPWDFDPPSSSIFTLANSDGTNLILTDDPATGLEIDSGAPVTATGSASRIAYVTLSNPTLAWDLLVKMKIMYPMQNFSGLGLIGHNSTSGRSVRPQSFNNAPYSFFRFSALGTYNSTPYNSTPPQFYRYEWWHMFFDGTNVGMKMTNDGIHFMPVYSEAASTFVNAAGGNMDRVGLSHTVQRATGPNQYMTVEYWSLTGPGV